MRSLTRLAIASGITLTLCVAAGVVGVVALLNPPSPTTRITAADGSVVTLDWRDFPASSDPDLDPQDVLDAPRAEDVAAVVTEQIESLGAGLAPALPGVEWNPADPDEPTLFQDEGNGYGGETLLHTYNASASTDGSLPGGAGWNTLTDALDAQLSDLGYDGTSSAIGIPERRGPSSRRRWSPSTVPRIRTRCGCGPALRGRAASGS